MMRLAGLTLLHAVLCTAALAEDTPAHWPENKAESDGTYKLTPVQTIQEDYGEDFETFHGGYGSLLKPTSSSALASQGSNTYAVTNLGDDLPSTAWVEGVEGQGVGEWIEFEVGSDEPGYTCGALAIVNGYQKSKSAFQNNSRVKAFDLMVDGKKLARLELLDKTGEQHFKLPVKLGARARLVIAEVYPGAKYKDTAITEMYMMCAP